MLLPRVSGAQERDPAAAQALFDQARGLSKQGKYAEACPKLQESNRLDPGIGTQFYLADCYEQTGRVASAWATFLDVASQAHASGQSDREKAATKRAEKLEPRLPRLVVNVAEANRATGLEVRRNGMLVGAAQWGAPVPVDPGEVELTMTAPGKRPLKQTLRLEEGKTASYDVPLLVAEPSAAAPAAAETSASPTATAAESNSPVRDEGPSNGRGGWIWGLAGVGVVGVGVGTTFALLAKSQYDDSKAECLPDDANACSSTGIDLRDRARMKGNVATAGFAVGGAALVAAGVIWLTTPSSAESSTRVSRWFAAPSVAPDHAGVFVQGAF